MKINFRRGWGQSLLTNQSSIWSLASFYTGMHLFTVIKFYRQVHKQIFMNLHHN